MKLETLNLRISPRRELRLALLAAMEACWVFAALALVGGISGAPAPSVASIFLAYWVALVAGRVLPRLKIRWAYAQMLALALAAAMLFYLAWIELYARQWLLDPGWLPFFLRALAGFSGGITSAHLIAAAVIVAFTRGLAFAQRPLTLWFIGFQFRMGILFFFLILLAAGFGYPLDLSAPILFYFVAALFALALARMDELGNDLAIGTRWAITLGAGVALVIFLGLGGIAIFTLQIFSDTLRFFAPLAALFSFLFLLLAIPFGFLADFLFNLLAPLFAALRQALDNFLINFQTRAPPKEMEPPGDALNALDALLPLLQTLGILIVLFLIGSWIARALSRRVRAYEEENFSRESIGADPDAARAEARRKKHAPARRASVDAENIRRIYAALVARTAAAGVARQAAETPNELLPRLERGWQDRAEDLDSITRAYVAVHYGEENAASDLVARVRAAWQRVEAAIRLGKSK